MIRRWQNWLNRINRVTDWILAALSYYAACFLWLGIVRDGAANPALDFARAIWPVAVCAVLLVCIFQLVGLYAALRSKSVYWDIKHLFVATLAGLSIALALLYIFRLEEFSRGVVFLYFILLFVLVLLKRICMRVVLNHFRKRGYNQKHIIVVGCGDLAKQYVDTIQAHPGYGYTIDGYIGSADAIGSIACLGGFDRMGTLLAKPGIDELTAALDQSQISLLPQLIAITETNGIKLSIIPYYNNYIPASATFEVIGDCKLINVRTTPLDFPLNAAVKRLLDIACAAILIVITSPLMLLAAIGTKLSSPGPIIFKQIRVGKNKKQFQMYKFRSMRVNAQQDTGWTKDADPRKTKFGSFLRKTSIDELPQFFNVLKGDMSLIGPRPEVPHFVEQFKETVPLYMLKHLVRPGITGWAQVNGYRGDTSIVERIKCDIWYIENWSILLDIRILFRTVFGGMINSEQLGSAQNKDA